MNVRFIDLFKTPVSVILTLLSLATGPVLTFSQILTPWQGAIVTLVLISFLLFFALLGSHKRCKQFQSEVKKLSENRKGLIEAKDRYLEESSNLHHKVTNLNVDNLRLSQMLAIVLSITQEIDPEEKAKLLSKMISGVASNNEIAGGIDIDRG